MVLFFLLLFSFTFTQILNKLVLGGKEAEGFNFDQIMESVNLNSLLGGMGGPVETTAVAEGKPPASATQSRFSQFFKARPEEQVNNFYYLKLRGVRIRRVQG